MWICRLWKFRSRTDGWVSGDMYEFDTEKDARVFGEFFLSIKEFEIVSKDYEVFERGSIDEGI